MWRTAVSWLAVVLDTLLFLFLVLALIGQTVLAGGGSHHRTSPGVSASREEAPSDVMFGVEGFLMVTLAVNVIAVLAGARAFPPRPRSSDLVSTFD